MKEPHCSVSMRTATSGDLIEPSLGSLSVTPFHSCCGQFVMVPCGLGGRQASAQTCTSQLSVASVHFYSHLLSPFASFWLPAISLTVRSSFDVTDVNVTLLSAVCPVFSAGCLPASYSDLSWNGTYSWIADREIQACQERTYNPKLHCRARFLCHGAHSECSFSVYSWDDTCSQESSLPECLVFEILARPNVLRLRHWTHLFLYSIKNFSLGPG